MNRSILALAVSFAAMAQAQTPAGFEVATIKPSDQNSQGEYIRLPSPGHLSITNMTLLGFIRFAYGEGLGTNLEITGGPAWIDKDHYNLEAQAQGTPPLPELRRMLRALLEDRFSLKVHTVSKEINVYALVLAKRDGKLGPKVHPWDGACAGGRTPSPPQPKSTRCSAMFKPPGMTLEGASMAVVADMLSTAPPNLGRPVVDRTGLEGAFNLELDFDFQFRRPGALAQPLPDDATGPSLFTALQEQWGLKLEPSKGMVDALVVDRAERPSAN